MHVYVVTTLVVVLYRIDILIMVGGYRKKYRSLCRATLALATMFVGALGKCGSARVFWHR